ncbi:MAG: hypothetical protein R6X19_00875 [Kiritimatiellia bacterium]
MEILFDHLSAVPNWLVAVFLLIAGGLAATVARLLIVRLLQLLRFNHLCDRLGATDFLRTGGVSNPPAELVGRGISGLLLIGIFLEAARILDISAIHELRQRAAAALPALLSALLVLAVGLMVVAFLAGFLRTVVRNAGNPYANLWARIARWTGAILVLALALEQADIRGTILPGVIQIVIAAFAFGMALAFGLGCKEMARHAMERLVADLKERHREDPKPDLEG